MKRGTTAAVAARTFDIPAARIRKWLARKKVHRHPDGSIDIGCLQARILRRTVTTAEYRARHSEWCTTAPDERLS